MPAAMRRSIISLFELDGPRVQTILQALGSFSNLMSSSCGLAGAVFFVIKDEPVVGPGIVSW
jgi:hypothetical protein